ncbi:hypothetical protein ANO11243_078270 [Dothideomycetidae sp. 11243]|nr:hypothetical protein ANO11243_078270 [fungal sp. No.11243]
MVRRPDGGELAADAEGPQAAAGCWGGASVLYLSEQVKDEAPRLSQTPDSETRKRRNIRRCTTDRRLHSQGGRREASGVEGGTRDAAGDEHNLKNRRATSPGHVDATRPLAVPWSHKPSLNPLPIDGTHCAHTSPLVSQSHVEHRSEPASRRPAECSSARPSVSSHYLAF